MQSKKSSKIPKGSLESVNRRRTGQTKKDKGTNNDLQNIAPKTKDRVTRAPLKTGDELRCSGRVGSSCSTSC
jgi:hypothetical protein